MRRQGSRVWLPLLVALLLALSPLVVHWFADEPTPDSVLSPASSTVAEVSTPHHARKTRHLPVATPDNNATIPAHHLKTHQPNELGSIPILMYHVITTDPDKAGELYRTVDQLQADLQWLYDNDFYVVPLMDVVTNRISAPAGKHPVALTFDDGTSTQFSFRQQADGTLVPDPNCAVGILEEFFHAHPDFGRGGHFALIIGMEFAQPDASQQPLFEQKIRWLADHGYEVGNHTLSHVDNTNTSQSAILWDISEPMIWADKRLGNNPANASRIVTWPFGAIPASTAKPHLEGLLRHGYGYEGQQFRVLGATTAWGGPSTSPNSRAWNPMRLTRIGAFDGELGLWQKHVERDRVMTYVSDGDPDVVSVPSNLPPNVASMLRAEDLHAQGKDVVMYDVETGSSVDRFFRPAHGASRPRAVTPTRRDVACVDMPHLE